MRLKMFTIEWCDGSKAVQGEDLPLENVQKLILELVKSHPDAERISLHFRR